MFLDEKGSHGQGEKTRKTVGANMLETDLVRPLCFT